eukprot:1471758-Prymnesium_polylepis.1
MPWLWRCEALRAPVSGLFILAGGATQLDGHLGLWAERLRQDQVGRIAHRPTVRHQAVRLGRLHGGPLPQ